MRIFIIGLLLLFTAACSKDNDNNQETGQEEPFSQLVGTWEYFRGVELRCDSLEEVGDFPIDEFNRNTWQEDGTFFREYQEDDGSMSSFTGRWTYLGKEDNSFVYKTVIDGISGSDTTYILFQGNIFLNYGKDCFSVPYDPYNIREGAQARKID